MEDRLEKIIPYGPIELDGGFVINYIRIGVHHWNGATIFDLTPCNKTDGIMSIRYDGKTEHQGFKIVVGNGRKSKKKLEKLADVLWKETDTIVSMFSEKRYSGIIELVKKTVGELGLFK